MMDNPDYLEKALLKLDSYQRNGYFLGDNLIITYETGNHPLDTRLIENTILHFYGSLS